MGVAVLRPCIGRRSTSSAGSSHRSTRLCRQYLLVSTAQGRASRSRCGVVLSVCRSTSKTCRRPWHARDEKAWRRGRAGRPIAANVAGRLPMFDWIHYLLGARIRSQAPRAPESWLQLQQSAAAPAGIFAQQQQQQHQLSALPARHSQLIPTTCTA